VEYPIQEEKELAIHQAEDKRNPGKYKVIAPHLLLKGNMVVPYVNFRKSADPTLFPCLFTILSRTLFHMVAFLLSESFPFGKATMHAAPLHNSQDTATQSEVSYGC
jgi:hypothetical protein